LIKDYIEQRRALREAIHADPIDEAAIRQQSAKVAALGADLAVQRAHIAHDLRAVLTTDQLAKLKDWQVDLDAKIDQFLEQRAKRAAGE
jgi:protein CpxP